jgi:hypothetical protein
VRKSPRFHQKSPKKFRSYLPKPKILRIQRRHIGGEKNSEIARAEGCDRHTVARIVKAPEMATYIEEMRARFNGFAPLALDAVEHGLAVSRDPKLAIEVLKDIGVIEPFQNRIPVEDEAVREARLTVEWAGKIAMMALERHKVYGTELPPGLEELKAGRKPTINNGKDDDEEKEKEALS